MRKGIINDGNDNNIEERTTIKRDIYILVAIDEPARLV